MIPLSESEHLKKSRLRAGGQDDEFSPSGDFPLTMEREGDEQGLAEPVEFGGICLESGKKLNGETQIPARPKHQGEEPVSQVTMRVFSSYTT